LPRCRSATQPGAQVEGATPAEPTLTHYRVANPKQILLQKASLSSEIADLEKSLKAAKQEAGKATSAVSAATEKAASAVKKAESQAKTCAGELTTAKVAAKEAASAGSDAASCQAKLVELDGSDVQAVLALRRNTLDGIATVKQYSGKAYEEASKAAEQATKATEVYTKLAQDEAGRLYSKAVPVVEDTHKKCLEAVGPHIDAATKAAEPHIVTAKEHFRFSLGWLTTKLTAGLTEAAVHVPAIKPHVALVAKIGAHCILIAPFALLGLFVFFAVIRRFSLLLLKLEYTVLFVLLGLVLAVSGMALATKSDPLSALRGASMDSYRSLHNLMAGCGISLGVIQFSLFLSKAETGKQRYMLLLSLVAAGMNVLLIGHYYNMVYKKAAENPKFSMSFPIKGDGSASFAEYTIFTAAVVLFSAFSTPSEFRFSSRALIMSLESTLVGFCFGLLLLSDAAKDPLAKLFQLPMAPYVVGGGVAFLAGVLALRFLARLLGFDLSYSLFVSGAHMGIAGWALFQVGQVPYKNFHTGATEPLSNDALAKCAKLFLGLLFLQVCRTAYKAPSLPVKPAAKTSSKPAQQLQQKGKGSPKRK